MKSLPLGIQDFGEIINNNYLYVDKTKQIHYLLSGKYYFLSRPRRFGKSLLISTMKELFSGNKELFKDLWIYDKYEWEEYPVIKISFSEMPYKNMGLQNAMNYYLDELAESFNLSLDVNDPGQKLKKLIIALSSKNKVAILIDEYDKPIIDYIEEIDQATENRAVLKNFYSVLKDADSYIRFLFLLGFLSLVKFRFFRI